MAKACSRSVTIVETSCAKDYAIGVGDQTNNGRAENYPDTI
jgi:hypothetical protein